MDLRFEKEGDNCNCNIDTKIKENLDLKGYDKLYIDDYKIDTHNFTNLEQCSILCSHHPFFYYLAGKLKSTPKEIFKDIVHAWYHIPTKVLKIYTDKKYLDITDEWNSFWGLKNIKIFFYYRNGDHLISKHHIIKKIIENLI